MPNDATDLPSDRPALARPLLGALVALLGLTLILGLGFSNPPAVLADDTVSDAEDERLEAVERHTSRGWKAFRSGNHDEVLARMKRLRRYDKESWLPDYLTARVLERTGKYTGALALAAKAAERWPDNRRIQSVHFRLLATLGELEALVQAAKAALARDPDDLVARGALGQAQEERGNRTEALANYDKVINGYNALIRSGAEIPAAVVPPVARAAERATWLSPIQADDLLPKALKMLHGYMKAHPEDQDVRLQVAALFRSDTGASGQSTARKYYRLLLKENSELAEARVGRARTDLVFYQQSAALKQLSRALVTNPNLVSALSLKAAIHVGNGDYKRATEALDKALALRPEDKEARAVKAALLWIRGDKDAHTKLVEAVLARDPAYGHLYVICAELVGERQRRYDMAEMFARKAIEIEPGNRFAYTVLGESLMNTGRTDDALTIFNRGVKASKRYEDVRRDNWRKVLKEVMPNYKVLTSEHFRVRLPLGEAKITGPYLMALLEESYTTLTKKYGMETTVPIHVDAFDDPNDFSVRSVGSPGLPALGVCFGNVITILCPTARDVGSFSWSRTTWHEFAHVVTLQLSNGQVPRWLTEGLSVFEEEQRRARWGREMEQQLYSRWRNGRLLKMAEINSAFRGPDILFAYFQGGLISQHLQQDKGFQVIPDMLRKFGEDRTTKQVFQDVLSMDLGAYDKEFHAFVGKMVGDYKMVPIWDAASVRAFEARTAKDPKDTEAWIRQAWAHFQRQQGIDAGQDLLKAMSLDENHPEVVLLRASMAARNKRMDLAQTFYEKYLASGEDDLRARLFLANRILTQGGSSAKVIEHLEAAKRCFPRYVAKDSPYLQLSRLYRGGGKFEKSIGELEAFAAISAEDMGVRKELLKWYLGKQDWETVARICEEMVDISPFGTNVKKGQAPDLQMHRTYAKALKQIGGPDAAILRELEVQVELGTLLDEQKQIDGGCVGDRVDLGRQYLKMGRADDARSQASGALRLSPSDANARMLMQQAAEGDGR